MVSFSCLLCSTLLLLLNICNISAQRNWDIPANPVNTGSHHVILVDDYGDLKFDKENSKVLFDFVSEETIGTIGGLDYSIELDPEHIDNASFKGKVLVDELETGNFLRDGHLMWKKFFYKNKYPTITFESTKVISEGSRSFKVIGDLRIKGITKEIIIEFTLFETELIGKTTIYTSDYDINIQDEREKNKLNIKFTFPLLKY